MKGLKISRSEIKWIVTIFIYLHHFFEANCLDDVCITSTNKLRRSYYCDNFLISTLTSERQNLRSLSKYLNYKMQYINKELNKTCKNFFGAFQEQSMDCYQKTIPQSCREAMVHGSGLYQLQLVDGKPFFAYCLQDPNGGDPWTLIQRRQDDAIKFDREFDDYTRGFGDTLRSHWIGLEKLYKITRGEVFELWIELHDFENNTAYAKYSQFGISGSHNNYRITSLGSFSGTAGNSLHYNNGFGFSTALNVTDGGKDCGKTTKSGWWFANCGDCNLNAPYYSAIQPSKPGIGIFWGGWKGQNYSLQYTHMAIREKYPKFCY